MTVYATAADLEHSLDQTIIAQLCADGGTPMPAPNAVTTAALERASSIVLSYIRVGETYSDAEIAALAAAHDPLLVGLTVDLAVEFLYQRRGSKISPAIEQRIKQTYSYLEGLRDGKMLFGSVDGNVAAGTPAVTAVSASNLAWYGRVSASQFFPPRRGQTYP
jgi:phage gp36-like protein